MFVSDCLDVNSKGHLTIGGCDTVELASVYGTPLYVMDEQTIRENCRKFRKSIEENYHGRGLVLYASKVLSCKEIYRIAADEGLGVDVVSGGELYTAAQAGFPMERVVFHGNNKTAEEMRMGLEYGIGRFVVDNLIELDKLNNIAASMNRTAKIMLRIKPGIDAHTHSFIQTGQIDSKFGVALENGEAMQAVKKAITLSNIELLGLHCHIGSQIFDIEPFELAAKVMVDFIYDIKKETGLEIQELNLGGGFGIRYIETDHPQPGENYMKRVASVVNNTCAEYGIPAPFIYIEPGRSITGPAGLTLYTVGSVKTIENVRTYVAVDGGMADNPRYILYQSDYDVLVADRAAQPRDFKATIAGRCCESGDLIQENTMIQKPENGDILAVLATGAYNYSMASNYNRIPKPAMVMVNNGIPRIIIQRETYEDLVRNDV